MALLDSINALQNCVTNSLGDFAIGEKAISAVIGDAPSQYSKSPSLWNAAFQQLQIDTIYLPLDVPDHRLGELLKILKQSERFWGANVTVPHKVRIMEFLDEIDPGARRIEAVNTVVRTPTGRLVGYNTDGEGFVASILECQPGHTESFVSSLDGMNVMLLGAGGSARAVAFHTAALLHGGSLLICNRTLDHALALAEALKKSGLPAVVIDEAKLAEHAHRIGLIVNSTTKGQGGVRKLPNGRVTKLEPYSALAPAHPPSFAASAAAQSDFDREYRQAARDDIELNNEASLRLASSIPTQVRFYDLIYHPEETVFLRHGRVTGHVAMNGKDMIIHQAAIAFYKHICRAYLQERSLDDAATRKQVLAIMQRAW